MNKTPSTPMQQTPDTTPDDHPQEPEAKPERPKRATRAKVAAIAQAPEVDLDLSSAADPLSAPSPARKTAKRSKKVSVAEEAMVESPVVEEHMDPVAPIAPIAPAAPIASIAQTVESPIASTEPDSAPLPLTQPRVHGVFQLADDANVAGTTEQPYTQRESRRERAPRSRQHREDEARGNQASMAPNSGQETNGPLDEAGSGHPSRETVLAEQAAVVFADLLSGNFDEKYEQAAVQMPAEDEPTKRILRPDLDAPKLQKVLAQSGVGSRRDIEDMIEAGRIAVNNEVAHIGQRIAMGDTISVDGKPIRVRIQPPPARILAYHKPVGEVVTHEDPQDRPTVFRNLPRLQHGKWQSVGRLDLNTEGLLLFSTSGDLANKLMHPRFGVEREYAVRVLGTLTAENKSLLLQGIDIEGQMASFKAIEEGGGEGANRWYRVVITEGRNREVRKLFEAVGLVVSRLIRVRYGAIVLPHGLKRGAWVELGESDVRAIRALTGMNRQEAPRRDHNNDRQQGRNSRSGRPAPGNPRSPGHHPQGRPRYQDEGAGRGQRPTHDARAENRPHATHEDDIDHIGRIPNPLEQTFDRRFATGSKRITSGFGRPDQRGQEPSPRGKSGGSREPDPLQTSVGYIGADAFFGNKGGGSGRGGRGGGNSSGGGGKNRR